MPDFEITIKTSADLKAAEALKGSLNEQVKAAKALGQDAALLEGQLRKVDSALNSSAANGLRLADAKKRAADAAKRLGTEQQSLGEKLSGLVNQIPGLERLSGIFSGKLAAGLAGVTALLAGAAKALREFAGAQESIASLDRAAANRGLLTEDFRRKLQGLAGELQNLTAIADDQWIPVLERLISFGANAGNIDAYATAVKNLAGLLRGDVNQAANLWTRAMTGNFEMLKRLGVEVDENVSLTDKLRQAQEQLAERGGGILEARARTLNGQFGSLKNAVGDVWEAFGNLISKTGLLQTVLGLLAQVLKAGASLLPDFHDKLAGIENRVPALTQGVKGAATAFGDLGEAVGDAASGGLEKFKTAAEQAAAAIDKASEAARKLQSQEDQEDEARVELALAQIEEREVKGGLTPLEARKLRAAAKLGLAQRKARREHGRLATDLRRFDELEGGLQAGAESALGKSAQTAGQTQTALQRAQSLGVRSDEEVELERIRAALAQTNRRSGKPIVQGEQRQILESNLQNLQARIAAGQVTFTGAQAAAQEKLAEEQLQLEKLLTGGSGRMGPDIRAKMISETQTRVTGLQERVGTLAELARLQRQLQEDRKAAGEAATRLLETQAEVAPRRRETAHSLKLSELRSTRETVEFRAESARIQREGTGGAATVTSTGQAAPRTQIDTQPAAKSFESASAAVEQALKEMSDTTVSGFLGIGELINQQERVLGQVIQRMATIERRQANLRLQ